MLTTTKTTLVKTELPVAIIGKHILGKASFFSIFAFLTKQFIQDSTVSLKSAHAIIPDIR